MNYNEVYVAPPWEFNEEQFNKQKEKETLKKNCSFTGSVIIISSIVFLLFSVVANFTIELLKVYTKHTGFSEGTDSLCMNILSGFCNITAIGICGAIFIKRVKNTSVDTLPFEKIGIKKLLAFCAIGFSVCNLSNYLTNIFINSAYSFGIDLNIDTLNFDSNSIFEIIVYLISVAVVPAFSEELLFRGVILSSLRKHGDGVAVFVSSLFFGIFHGNFIQFPFAFIVGLVLSFSVVYTNSMLPAIMIHFLNNSYSVAFDVLYTNTDRWNLSESIINILICLIVVLSALIAIISLVVTSRRDKEFLRLRQYDGLLQKKEINKTILTNPAIIIAFLFLLGESVLTHLM